ncbi:YceI family protein [Cellulophaga sp. HaHaR_3_176]|uniref:YceI family protein n=1 Tax=Cellulophaga sp. HaHaR_3_176 TaxID=1942464 RepID=UPI001C1F6139|nr:YceI family protein [Cellulophaga sp. HaHaR_3_176]QWX84411.1 YceI family protein [Cellulophaga sp. HaHaR_3_176]
MKRNTLSLVFALVFGATAFATTPVERDKKEIKVSESSVVWKAYKVTGSHEGTIDLKEGSLLFDAGTLTGGEFVVDMTTIVTTDLKAGEGKEKLEGHLHSDDFFGTTTHTTSKIVFTSIKATGKNSYEVIGDLTIKGKTAPITFDVSVYGSKATATLKVDRTKYDVKYGSGAFFDNLGDKTIYDEFDLVVDLEF